MNYIVDLDNTLVNTDKLNNAAYNFALKHEGFAPICLARRLTRNIVFDTYSILDASMQSRIVDVKQSFFMQHLEQSSLNQDLLSYLTNNESSFVIWTSADARRANELLSYYKIRSYCEEVFLLDKSCPGQTFSLIIKDMSWQTSEVCVIDDDSTVVQILRDSGIEAILISDFMQRIGCNSNV